MGDHVYEELQATQILLARLIFELERNGNIDIDWVSKLPKPVGPKPSLSFDLTLPRIAELVKTYHLTDKEL